MHVALFVKLGILGVLLLAIASGAYGEFLVNGGSREFCGPVPNVPEMEIIQPDDYVGKKCDAKKYQHEIASAVAPTITIALLFLIALPLVFITKFLCGCFGGPKPTTGLCFGGQERRAYRSQEVFMATVAVFVVGTALLTGSIITIVGSDQISKFTYEVMNIFETQTDYISSTLEQIEDTLKSLPYNANRSLSDVLSASNKASKKFKGKTDDLNDSLKALDHLRSGFTYFTAIVSLLTSLGGVLAALIRTSRLSLACAFVAFLVGALVWIHFSFLWAASNIFHDMCDVINGCHFCFEAGHVDCPDCDVPFFANLANCPDSAANRFRELLSFNEAAMAEAATAVCQAVNDVCTAADNNCIKTECSLQSLLAYNITTLVETGPGTNEYVSIAEAAQNATAITPPEVVVAAGYAMGNLSVFSQYVETNNLILSMNCSAPQAFLETVPQGTFDQLQKFLCPKVPPDPQPPITLHNAISLNAAGLLVIGITMPFAIFVMMLGYKRFRIYYDESGHPLLHDYRSLNRDT